MNNIHNVEKTMQKYRQLAKDAQSNGDPVLVQNYLQHADHYLRRYNELNEKEKILTKKLFQIKNHWLMKVTEKENQQISN